MNERDLKATCKEIKGFDPLIQLLWQIVAFVRTTLYSSLFIHLPSATFNHFIREKYFRNAIYVEVVKITFFFFFFCFVLYLNTFCTCLTHILRILIARYSTALSTLKYNVGQYLSVCFVKTTRWYYDTKKDWWAWLPLQIRKYIQCSKLSVIMTDLLNQQGN